MKLEALFTIGHTKKSLGDFIERLKRTKADCVVDIRLHNTSQLAGFAKKDDLEFLLTEGFGISYIHMPELAPTEDILERYKKDKDWENYQPAYEELIGKRNMVEVFLEALDQHGWKRPCLLCSEDKSEKCHRRLLANALQRKVNGLEVEHL